MLVTALRRQYGRGIEFGDLLGQFEIESENEARHEFMQQMRANGLIGD